jgi:hypothetical protein
MSRLDESGAIDISSHDGNNRVGWKSNDAQVFLVGLNSHRRRGQFDVGPSGLFETSLMHVSGVGIQNISGEPARVRHQNTELFASTRTASILAAPSLVLEIRPGR